LLSLRYEYLWQDETMKKPIRCSAPEYVDHLMTWVQSKLDDETIFPSRVGTDHFYIFFFFHYICCISENYAKSRFIQNQMVEI
jgi:hypothetical protein